MSKYSDVLARYDALVNACPRFERKGKTMPFTSANGYMFSLLNKAGELGIRFSKERQKTHMDTFETTIFKSYGAIMRGYILITEKMLADESLMIDLLNESYDYVLSQPPK